MKEYRRDAPQPMPEEIIVLDGPGAHPIQEKVVSFGNQPAQTEPATDESILAEMLALAELIRTAKTVIESQEGQFLGTKDGIVFRKNPRWGGSNVEVQVTYVLCYKDPRG